MEEETVETLVSKLSSASEQTRTASLCELRLCSKYDPETRPKIAPGGAIPYIAKTLFSSSPISQENGAATLEIGAFNMKNLTKFEVLDVSGKNYMSWMQNAKTHLGAEGFGNTIEEENQESVPNRLKAVIFLRNHLHKELKDEYFTVNDPLAIWKRLEERYEHQKIVILTKARYDWENLWFCDFDSVSAYNSALVKISPQLKLCGENITDEDMLEKTNATFPVGSMVLQQLYRQRGFTKYSELFTELLLAEHRKEVLMKNDEASKMSSKSFSDDVTNYSDSTIGGSRGYGGSPGRNHGNRNWNKDEEIRNGKGGSQHSNNVCYRCGTKGHWSRTCRTSNHLVKLYQASLKKNGENDK